MRILFIINNYPIDSSKGMYFKHQMDALESYGHTVSAILFDKYRFGSNYSYNDKIFVLNQPSYLKVVYPLVSQKVVNKIRCTILKQWVTMNPKMEYDITVVQPSSQFAIIFSFLKKEQLRKFGKIVFYEHNYINLNGNKLRKQIRKGFNIAHKILVVSNDKIRQFYLSGMSSLGHKIINIGNPVDTNKFIPKSKLGVRMNRTEILIVTFDGWIKDPDTLLNTIRLCIGDEELKGRLRFTIIGLSPLRSGTKSEAARKILALEATGLIRILNSVPNEDMPDYYNNSDCFLLTSIQEGMPVSVLEAMSCGLPIFSTRCGGVEDIVDKYSGIIVPVGDSRSLYESIKALCNGHLKYDPNYIRSKIVGQYDYDTWVQKFISNAQ